MKEVLTGSASVVQGLHTSVEYIAGGIIGFLLLCYLVYTLIKPEKF